MVVPEPPHGGSCQKVARGELLVGARSSSMGQVDQVEQFGSGGAGGGLAVASTKAWAADSKTGW